MNTLFLDALACRNTSSRPPVWLMRQAGRYMPAYRALRQKYSFLDICHHPELLAEATLMPIQAFDLDAAILFSDILIIPEALGLGLRFEEDVGPIFERPLKHQSEIDALPQPDDLSGLQFIDQGIRLLKSRLHVPLIGFCGAPFTLASYMIEGQTSRDFKKTKHWMFSNPESFHRLLTTITDWSIAYLNLQIDAGVDALQIFDSWANSLAYPQFCEFSLSYLNTILKGLKRSDIPVILYCRGSSVFAPALADIKPAAISLDWNCNIADMRQLIPPKIALQGNLDPLVLCAPKRVVEREVNQILDKMEGDKGFIFNLGHGVVPETPEESVRTLVECIKKRALCPSML